MSRDASTGYLFPPSGKSGWLEGRRGGCPMNADKASGVLVGSLERRGLPYWMIEGHLSDSRLLGSLKGSMSPRQHPELYSEWRTETTLVRMALLAGPLHPPRASSVISAPATERDIGSCTWTPTSMLTRRRSRNHARAIPMMPPARIRRMACDKMRRSSLRRDEPRARRIASSCRRWLTQ